MGKILLSGANGIPSEKSVKAAPATGIQLVFAAATNRYTAAYYDMHRAYRDGIGVPKDIVRAYAWLQLDAESSGFVTASARQAELNRLALDIDVSTSQAGKRLAPLYRAGHWPTLTVLPPQPTAVVPAPVVAPKVLPSLPISSPSPPKPRPDPGLKLNGIAYGKIPLAIINGKGLAEGETVTLPLKPKPVRVKCVKIETNSVLVILDGEQDVRRLRN